MLFLNILNLFEHDIRFGNLMQIKEGDADKHVERYQQQKV